MSPPNLALAPSRLALHWLTKWARGEIVCQPDCRRGRWIVVAGGLLPLPGPAAAGPDTAAGRVPGGKRHTGQLNGKTTIVYAVGLEKVAGLAAEQLGCPARLSRAAPGAVDLSPAGSLARAGGVQSDIGPVAVVIAAGSPTAALYGVQTLAAKSSAPPSRPTRPALPGLPVAAAAAFSAWRGLMLDCSRTFQSLDYLRRPSTGWRSTR